MSENFEYHGSEKTEKIEMRVEYTIWRMLKTAEGVEDHSKNDEVGLNNTVEIYCEDDKGDRDIPHCYFCQRKFFEWTDQY